MAERITWSLSVMMMDRVLRPCVASTSLPRPAASSRKRFIGADCGETIDTTRDETTTFP